MLRYRQRFVVTLSLCVTLLSTLIHPALTPPTLAAARNATGSDQETLANVATPQQAGDAADAAGATRAATAALTARATTKVGQRNQPRAARTVHAESDPSGTQPALYIIQLIDAPLATYRGEVANFSATSPKVTGARKLAVTSTASTSYRAYLAQQRDQFRRAAEAQLGHAMAVIYTYDVAFHGLAVKLTPQEAAKLVNLAGVATIQRSQWRYAQTDLSPAFLGVTGVWNGTTTGGLPGTKGEGVIVGVIDSGIWPEHPSFADDGSYPAPPATWQGECQQPADESPGYTCTNKLIGIQYFLEGYSAGIGYDGLFYSGRDDDGHGTHTASTAAGNENVAAAIDGINRGRVSGMAPRAYVAAYKGLGPNGGTTADLTAAIDKAVADGVDVINYSVGSDFAADPWVDADAQAYLAALEAGVFVATSAGNAGPGVSTIGSPANAPWVTSVGASYYNRLYLSEITVNASGGASLSLYGATATPGVTDFHLVDATGIEDSNGDTSGDCAAPFLPGTFQATDVVLCRSGGVATWVIGNFVNAGGASAVIIYNNETSYDLNSYLYSLPAVRVLKEVGAQLQQFLAAHASEEITVSFTQGTPVLAPDPRIPVDTVVGFSSRGPAINDANSQLINVIKPDVTAPGIHVLAGASPDHLSDGNGELDRYGGQGQLFQVIQGTSMSSPHVAGVGALLKALYPDWTPSQIRSALMTTALDAGQKARNPAGDQAADPFDLGAGRIDMRRAPLAGFTLDESAAAFQAANPNTGGDPATLNLASLTDAHCLVTCTWVRTIKSSLDSTVNWQVSSTLPPTVTVTVNPSSFALSAGASRVITITADVSNADPERWAYGAVRFTPNTTRTVEAHFPLAVYTTASNVPAAIAIETRRNAGSQTITGLETLTTANLGITLATSEPQPADILLAPDPTNGDVYDLEAGGVYTQLVTVPATTKRFIIEILDSTATDLDLFVGRDTDGDQQPDAAEELCSSASASWDEVCSFPQNNEPIQSGVYWIAIQNWQGSTLAKDEITYALTLIDAGDTGAMTATGPANATLGTPFAVQIRWDIPTLQAGDQRYGYLELIDRTHSETIGASAITLNRLDDDVTKAATYAGEAPLPGDLITYTLEIQPESTGSAPTVQYQLTDTLPAGVTYVPGSASVAPTVAGNQLRWNVTVETQPRYVMTTSATDSRCDTGFGGYVDLAQLGLAANPTITGNGVTFRFDDFYGGSTPVNFFGSDYPQGLYFTDDGFATLSTAVGSTPGVNRALPNAALPNRLIAPFWRDLAVVYNATSGRGVSVAGTASGAMLIEYDDVEPAPAGSTNQRYDFEVVMWRQPDDSPGAYEIIFAYDNLSGPLTPATIGLENSDGSVGVQYAHNNAQLSNGFMVCYDWVQPKSTITYAVKVNETLAAPATLTNQVAHKVNLPNTTVATATNTVTVPAVLLAATVTAPAVVAPGGNITYTVTVTNAGSGSANQVTAETTLPPGTTYVSGGTVVAESIRLTFGNIPGKSSKTMRLVVKPQAGLDLTTQSTAISGAAVQAIDTPQIIGGSEAKPGAWPWQVAIVSHNNPDAYAGQYCGGSLLDPNWVLTAAHCVTIGTTVDPAAGVDIIVGRHALTETGGQRLGVSQIIVHPAWDPEAYDYDIALLRLAETVELTGSLGQAGAVQPVTLATPDEPALVATERLATVTGWGTRKFAVNDYPVALYQTSVPLVSAADCAAAYPAENITARMLCAGFVEGGKDSCQGDSGGPLVVKDNGVWKQVGIVSWGDGCGDPGVPGVYTRLPSFHSWIYGDGSNTFTTNAFIVKAANGQQLSVAGATVQTVVANRNTRLYLPIIAR